MYPLTEYNGRKEIQRENEAARIRELGEVVGVEEGRDWKTFHLNVLRRAILLASGEEVQSDMIWVSYHKIHTFLVEKQMVPEAEKYAEDRLRDLRLIAEHLRALAARGARGARGAEMHLEPKPTLPRDMTVAALLEVELSRSVVWKVEKLRQVMGFGEWRRSEAQVLFEAVRRMGGAQFDPHHGPHKAIAELKKIVMEKNLGTMSQRENLTSEVTIDLVMKFFMNAPAPPLEGVVENEGEEVEIDVEHDEDDDELIDVVN